MQPSENIVMRERVDFSKIKTSIPIPNLIEIQEVLREVPADGLAAGRAR